ncbi:MAG TPA: hypothetical protein VGM64_01675 [Lacunisphaera sp.]|jgi:hypothetical protein
MSAPKSSYVFIAGLVAVAAVLLSWQRHTAERLQLEIVHQQETAEKERAQLEHENRRLITAQLSTGELQKLGTERTAVSSLFGEIESMRHRADQTARNGLSSSENAIDHSMTDGPVPARFWKKSGQATPAAAFETALWAGAGGNVESLAGLLVFDQVAQTKANAIFAALPAVMQRELATPERLIALLVAKDVPLGSAEILTQATPADPSADTKLAAKLTGADGKSKEVHLSLRATGGSWRFVVPSDAVERYATRLSAPADSH